MTVGDQIGRIVGAPAGSTVMHQNVAIAEAVVLSCFRPTPQRNRVVYERGNFPSVRYLYQAQPDLEVVVCEDDDEIVEAIDERTLLVPISHVLFKSGEIQDVERIVASRARGGRARDPRRLPVGRDRPARRHGARRRLRGRRLGQVALRRAGQRLALRPSRPRRAARADVHRLAGARGAVRRSRRRCATPPAPRASSPARRTCPRSTPPRRLRPDRGDRRRPDPRELAAPDGSPDRSSPTTAGFEIRSPRDRGRRGGTVTVHVDGVPGGARGAHRAADPLRLPARRRDPHRPALLHLRRRAPARDRPDRARSSSTGAHERHAGAVARH